MRRALTPDRYAYTVISSSMFRPDHPKNNTVQYGTRSTGRLTLRSLIQHEADSDASISLG
jgi:hypothetical protein